MLSTYYCDTFTLPLPEGHRFPLAKYARLRSRVSAELNGAVKLISGPAATATQLATIHDREYVRKVFEGRLSDLEQRRIGFPWSAAMVERCRRSVGSTIAASQTASREKIAVHLSGGTHHAFRDSGQGFCVFNDVAVAAQLLLNEARIARALVIDCDVHHGNGTAAIFADDDRVFTCSMHGENNYPPVKPPSDLDIPLPDGTGDEAYLAALHEAITTQLPFEETNIVFYLAGADPYRNDRMGRLKLTKEGLAQRDKLVIDHCIRCDVPLCITMSGGYAPNIEDIVEIHLATVKAAVAAKQRIWATGDWQS